MKPTITIAASSFLIFAASASQAQYAPTDQSSGASERRWSITFSDEVRLFSWRNNFAAASTSTGVGGKGSELYIPYALQVNGKPTDDFSIEVVGRGGWVKASQSTPGLNGEISTNTDTTVSGTISYLGWKGIQPFVAIQSSLPTGRSAIFGNGANARMDPDFVELSSFGEGLNIGPTAGLNFPISQSLMVSTSVGYTWRDRFQREASLTATPPILQVPTSINPGENLTYTASVNYNLGPISGNLTGSYSQETVTSQDGIQVMRPGDRYLLSGTLSYEWSKIFGVTTLNSSAVRAERNNVFNPETTALSREFLNSNSNVYRVGLQHLFPAGQFAFGPTGSVLYRDHNGYDSATLQFVPKKTRWSAGLLAQYSPNTSVTFNARIEGVWTHEDENPAPGDTKLSVIPNGLVPATTVPVISGTALQTSLGINIRM